ncbi:aminoglycoside phosphotransferase family protein [Actinoplanes oblitus]|uniref:Aminoglycoside phosphotransferase family protein n=1 Tax=Actinoplanes oblitus TaxID=3040509 RepID=A0ABY8WF03_9ACTN|nr:aminoglycoside phosphotransferase family protein [Actinoplanes oblitus]WIM96424.1 aminoglycoside phosphotransferase family protein [Actinoplanes oblitus]
MGVSDDWAARLDPGVVSFYRLRMMGVHATAATRGERAGGGARPETAEIRRLLSESGIERGEPTRIYWYTARRPVAHVEFSAGTPVVLKWLDAAGLSSGNESFALRLLRGLAPPDVLAEALPRLVGTSPTGEVQIFDYIDHVSTWAEQATNRGAPGAPPYTALGQVLAALHALPVDGMDQRYPDRRVKFPIPSLSRLTPAEFSRGYGTDFAEYVTAIQAVEEEMALMRETWTHHHYIHFDLHDDNVLFRDEEPSVALIDWEAAGFGEAAYDAGTVLGQILLHGLPGLQSGADSPAAAKALEPARTFLGSYLRFSTMSDEALLRIIQFAGVFLMMSNLGRLEKVGSLGRVGRLSLIVGRRLVQDPEPRLALFAARLGRQ